MSVVSLFMILLCEHTKAINESFWYNIHDGYVFVPEYLGYYDANEYCINNIGGPLGTINSLQENTLVYNSILDITGDNSSDFWIGLTYTNTFEDGTLVQYMNFDTKPNSQNECIINNYYKCVVVSQTGEWEYRDCNSKHNFICNKYSTGRHVVTDNIENPDVGIDECVYKQGLNVYNHHNAICLSNFIISRIDGTYLYDGLYGVYPVYKKFDANNEHQYFVHNGNDSWRLLNDVCEDDSASYYMKCMENSMDILTCNTNWEILPMLWVNNELNISQGKCENTDGLLITVKLDLCLNGNNEYSDFIGEYEYIGIYMNKMMYVKNSINGTLYLKSNGFEWTIDEYIGNGYILGNTTQLICNKDDLHDCNGKWYDKNYPHLYIMHQCDTLGSAPVTKKSVSVATISVCLLVFMLFGGCICYNIYMKNPRHTHDEIGLSNIHKQRRTTLSECKTSNHDSR